MVRKSTIDLVECPRDALQGWKADIPNDLIVRYLNTLLKVGFHTLDFGSFDDVGLHTLLLTAHYYT